MHLRRQLVGLVAAAIAVPGLLVATSQNAVAAPIALVQQSSSGTFNAGAHTNTINLTNPPAVGSLLVLVFRNGTDANDVSSVSGGGVTWAKAQSWTTPTIGDIWYGAGSTGVGTAITINLTGAPTELYSSGVSEWSGVATTNPLDGAPAVTTGTSATPTTPSITPAAPGELFVGLISSAGSFNPPPGAVGGGFTQLGLAGNNGAGYLIASDASAHAMSWTTTTSAAFTAGLVSFEPASASPAPGPAPGPVITPMFTG
ncbi:MAG TPA: hypothetical protein VI462_02125 [Acidimicrobiia bacterium]|jgi:hypothetical protein